MSTDAPATVTLTESELLDVWALGFASAATTVAVNFAAADPDQAAVFAQRLTSQAMADPASRQVVLDGLRQFRETGPSGRIDMIRMAPRGDDR